MWPKLILGSVMFLAGAVFVIRQGILAKANKTSGQRLNLYMVIGASVAGIGVILIDNVVQNMLEIK